MKTINLLAILLLGVAGTAFADNVPSEDLASDLECKSGFGTWDESEFPSQFVLGVDKNLERASVIQWYTMPVFLADLTCKKDPSPYAMAICEGEGKDAFGLGGHYEALLTKDAVDGKITTILTIERENKPTRMYGLDCNRK